MHSISSFVLSNLHSETHREQCASPGRFAKTFPSFLEVTKTSVLNRAELAKFFFVYSTCQSMALSFASAHDCWKKRCFRLTVSGFSHRVSHRRGEQLQLQDRSMHDVDKCRKLYKKPHLSHEPLQLFWYVERCWEEARLVDVVWYRLRMQHRNQTQWTIWNIHGHQMQTHDTQSRHRPIMHK